MSYFKKSPLHAQPPLGWAGQPPLGAGIILPPRLGSVAFPDRAQPLPMGSLALGGTGILLLGGIALGFWYFLKMAEKGYQR